MSDDNGQYGNALERAQTPPEDVADLIGDETGAVLVEYVTLLIGVLLAVYVTIMPLRMALISFATDVYHHLTLP